MRPRPPCAVCTCAYVRLSTWCDTFNMTRTYDCHLLWVKAVGPAASCSFWFETALRCPLSLTNWLSSQKDPRRGGNPCGNLLCCHVFRSKSTPGRRAPVGRALRFLREERHTLLLTLLHLSLSTYSRVVRSPTRARSAGMVASDVTRTSTKRNDTAS